MLVSIFRVLDKPVKTVRSARSLPIDVTTLVKKRQRLVSISTKATRVYG